MADTTILLETTLDVENKYEQLVKKSLDGDSVYVRTKETLTELLANNEITQDIKGNVIVQVMANLNNTVVTTAMSTALQWEQAEKSLYLEKYKLEKEIDALIAQTDLSKTNDLIATANLHKTEAEMLRMYGNATLTNGHVTALDDNGLVFQQIEIAKEDAANKEKEGILLDAKRNTEYAGIHKIVADTYANYGQYSYGITETGQIENVFRINTTGKASVTDTQIAVAAEQAKGYAYNAFSNAASSAASMIGVMLSTESGSALNAADVNTWRTALNRLNNVQVADVNSGVTYTTNAIVATISTNGVRSGGNLTFTGNAAIGGVVMIRDETNNMTVIGSSGILSTVGYSIVAPSGTGIKTFTAQFIDSHGNVSLSSPITVTVS